MDGNTYAQIRYKTASINLKNLLNVMEQGNQADFTRIVENEALSLHAMIMSSEPWQILMEPSTIEIIRKIRKYRENNASNVCFTLDAGPNIHLLYPENERDMILSFIKKELSDYCENGYWIDDKIGNGPQLLTKV
jgi:diphosphomevalonate decarboxylase